MVNGKWQLVIGKWTMKNCKMLNVNAMQCTYVYVMYVMYVRYVMYVMHVTYVMYVNEMCINI